MSKFGKARGDGKMNRAAENLKMGGRKIYKGGHSITLNIKHTVYKIKYKNVTLFIP